MSTALATTTTTAAAPWTPPSLPPVPWRDVHDVAPEELSAYITKLEQMCVEYPQSADVRTVLGIAHAVNLDVYKSMDALEDARAVDPENFWAQLKYAELQYRLRCLNKAEEETRRAADLAQNPMQLAIARKQMRGFGGMLTFVIKGGLPAARNFLRAVRIFACAESLGGVESLIEHPAIMTHASVPKDNREKLGITDGLIRISVGIEHVDDLIADLDQALRRAAG